MTPTPNILPYQKVRIPIHFQAWSGRGRPYNLCGGLAPMGNRWTPYRSVTTCPACLERLRP